MIGNRVAAFNSTGKILDSKCKLKSILVLSWANPVSIFYFPINTKIPEKLPLLLNTCLIFSKKKKKI